MHFCWNISQHSCEAGRSGALSRGPALFELLPSLELIWSRQSDQAWSLPRFQPCVSPILSIINEVWRLLQWDNSDSHPPPAILPIARFWWPRWLFASGWPTSAEKAGDVSYGASWVLIKRATMLSCWDLTWCPSYQQITLHIVHHHGITTMSPPLCLLILFEIK